MNNEMFFGLVKELHEARVANESATSLFSQLKKDFETSEPFLSAKENATETGKRVTALQNQLKQGLLEDKKFMPPFKAAWLIETTNIEIDDDKALTWARENMPVAISEVVDMKLLSKFAKDNEKKPELVPFATIIKGNDVRIASDLSKFL